MSRSKDVEPRVRKLLEDQPALRDSDKKLLLAVWEQEGFILSPHQRQAFLNTTPAESITRARRNLKAEFPASDAVDNLRFDNYLTEKRDHGTLPTYF